MKKFKLIWKSHGKPNKEIFKGFKKLKEGRIHLYCNQCGRKMSNMEKFGRIINYVKRYCY